MPEATHADAGHTECPACHGRLYPKVLHCADCGLDVTTRYAGNEFADLDAEDLHLLRIFVVCEGRIRDMESALGVSYPTVKSRLAALRGRLGLGADADAAMKGTASRESSAANSQPAASEPATAREILDQLAAGTTTYDEALSKIRALRGRS
ncbi:MAG TPA: DUF2089 family protein [Pseudomonadales bacterium]|nr:DUF2089 family protein [Pseudomonadales bacterium]